MANLVATDFYLQTLAKKICTQELREPPKRKFGMFGSKVKDESTPPGKKRKKKKEKNQKKKNTLGDSRSKVSQGPAKPASSNAKNPKSVAPITPGASAEERHEKETLVTPGVTGNKKAPGTNFAMDFLRQRLHNKMEEISGKASGQALSPAVLEKRQRRKYERERKKRRRKEIKMKEKLEKETAEGVSSAVVSETQQKAESKTDLLFNKVEAGAEEEMNKAKKKEDKRKSIKGNLTPLTGKNYKQLLTRLETRKTQLEELKAKDEEKAKELEAKMQWTNVLYKAEGVKIRDDEEKLKAALKHKEKRKAQRQRKWEKRTEQVVDRMQQRQEKRRKNIKEKKLARIEKKKTKARKKGRILPEDLKKAGSK
ncbi:surfeit locus protein 6 [Erythrolamprus reginae]|uniref:surfeit locus protein 6 n=1 Tax=Erythrolamprus reginae TaxID=121349 RepID=UPI00396C62D7